MDDTKKINQLKNGDIIFVHSFVYKWTKRCVFKKIRHPLNHNFVEIAYIDEKGKWGSAIIDKKYLNKTASLTITTDNSEEAIRQMEISRKADAFKKRNFHCFRSVLLKIKKY